MITVHKGLYGGFIAIERTPAGVEVKRYKLPYIPEKYNICGWELRDICISHK